jgi:glutathione synthase/RimK-type ligase-like ATP-grasp enzyme
MHEPILNPSATRDSRVALVTCAPMNGLDPDDELVVAPLKERGVHAEPAVWDDPAVDWAGYDLAVVRYTWDYYPRRDAFLAWARRVPRLANPAAVLAWNTDKRYLRDLAAAGVPTAPTTWIEPGEPWTPPATGEVVVKPAVSGGGVDTGRYDLADAAQRRLAAEHVRRLGGSGRLVMVQPYLSAVDEHGETALLWLGGRYSHAIRKGALLTGPDVGVEGLYRQEEITAREPTAEQLAVAERVLATVPHDAADLLYARVDLIPDGVGDPLLLEIELTEPSLFLGTAPGAPARLAEAIAGRLSRTGR